MTRGIVVGRRHRKSGLREGRSDMGGLGPTVSLMPCACDCFLCPVLFCDLREAESLKVKGIGEKIEE